jgi:hypothetical protein
MTMHLNSKLRGIPFIVGYSQHDEAPKKRSAFRRGDTASRLHPGLDATNTRSRTYESSRSTSIAQSGDSITTVSVVGKQSSAIWQVGSKIARVIASLASSLATEGVISQTFMRDNCVLDSFALVMLTALEPRNFDYSPSSRVCPIILALHHW